MVTNEFEINGELPLCTDFVFISADIHSDLVQNVMKLKPVILYYFNQEVEEKSSTSWLKYLNNSAVDEVSKGDIDNDMQVFTLNLMQVITSKTAKRDVTITSDPMFKKRIKIIEMSDLNKAQQQTYH